jgi:very-short-patch-repair endonuclease
VHAKILAMANSKARQLRGAMTDAERRLWSALRDRRLEGYKFRRQYPLGPFVLDFACIEHHLIVEADGGQHADNSSDQRRTAWLESQGWRVLRFWNNDILANTAGVADVILQTLKAASSGD